MRTVQKLKYHSYTVACQEVPDEISLIINISGCPHHCEGCHSKYLWDYTGNYISDDIEKIIGKYKGYISCVCFMGGDQNPDELKQLLQIIKSKYHLKTCVYTGLDRLTYIDSKWIACCDYIKIGSYQSDKGGLDNPNTNQRMYKNITNKFRKEEMY